MCVAHGHGQAGPQRRPPAPLGGQTGFFLNVGQSGSSSLTGLRSQDRGRGPKCRLQPGAACGPQEAAGPGGHVLTTNTHPDSGLSTRPPQAEG